MSVEIEQNRTVQLKRTFKDHQVQLPDHFRANWQLKDINEGVVQTVHEHGQACIFMLAYLMRLTKIILM